MNENLTPRQQVDDWNERFAIGQPVRYWGGAREGEGKVSRTRSRAWEICGHASVLIEGYSGGVALSHVEPLAMPPLSDADADLCRDLADVIRDCPPVQFELGASETLILIGLVQLACRHPLNVGESARFGRDLVLRLASALPAELHEIVDRGWHQRHDAVAQPVQRGDYG